MDFHCAFSDLQFTRNQLVRLARDDTGQDLALACRQALESRTGLAIGGLPLTREAMAAHRLQHGLDQTVIVNRLLEEIGGAAVYLVSDMATAVTGDVHFVDAGYNIISMPQPDALKTVDAAEEAAEAKAAEEGPVAGHAAE